MAITNSEILSFFKDKRVFITGHTGFKGSWLCKILADAGAVVTGYALEPNTEPNLFDVLNIPSVIDSHIGDIRDFDTMQKVFSDASPEIVIHLAAQPIVRDSFSRPAYTYETNVMGTVNILECVRIACGVRSFLNVTTDKVYDNKEWEWGYREQDVLDGYDPYSNSKSCSELVTSSYRRSFFGDGSTAISTARAGNVIGGGDFAPDRILPDCVRAGFAGDNIIVRNPFSTRPYQHVLEPLFAYLRIIYMQWNNPSLADCYNVGPDDSDCVTTGQITDMFCKSWGEGMSWINKHDGGPHEAGFLKLDSSKIKNALGWRPVLNIENAIEKTVQWAKAYRDGADCAEVITAQIKEYLEFEGASFNV